MFRDWLGFASIRAPADGGIRHCFRFVTTICNAPALSRTTSPGAQVRSKTQFLSINTTLVIGSSRYILKAELITRFTYEQSLQSLQ
jgi:hypothetical protein